MTPQSYREGQLKAYIAVTTMALGIAAFIAFCVTHPICNGDKLEANP